MITELGKKWHCPVLQCCNCCCLHISFLLISLAAQEAQSIPMASLWAHFTLGSSWNCLSCFGPLSQSKNFPFYFSKNYKAFDPSEVLVAVFIASSVGSHSLARALFHLSPVDMTDIYFCLHRSSSSQTKFYIITFCQLLHVFLCSKTSSKKVLGQWDTFICFDIQVEVIGSSVLDLQDKQWHIGVTDIDLRRTLNQRLEFWQYAWCHECAWMAWIWNVTEASWPQISDIVQFQSFFSVKKIDFV